MKKALIWIIIIAAITLAYFFFMRTGGNGSTGTLPSDYKNATYTIDGKQVTLHDGLSETPIENSSAKVITRYFGNEVRADLDRDGKEDVVFLLTQETGGSGTFFYVVAALNTENGYKGSDGFFLGDRIAPQTTNMSQNPAHDNVVVVNFAVRNPGESFAVRPSLGRSVWLKLDIPTVRWGEVVQNFEGESENPDIRFARIGETFTVHGISITLNAVTGDSRCPKGVECIWAGNVSADVTLKHQAENKTVTIRNDDSPLAFGGSYISISNVAPAAEQGVTIPASSYILTFTVTPK